MPLKKHSILPPPHVGEGGGECGGKKKEGVATYGVTQAFRFLGFSFFGTHRLGWFIFGVSHTAAIVKR